MLGCVENYGGMPAAARKQIRKLYLNQWLVRLGKRPVDLAKHLGVGQPYITNLGKGTKSNPSVPILLEMSEFLGITVNDLFKEPPKARSVEELRGYSPSAVRQLLAPGTPVEPS